MKCEFCPDFTQKTTDSPMGWCESHQCARRLNDSCTPEERDKRDYWGEMVRCQDGGR
jgi:hypothetical protein